MDLPIYDQLLANLLKICVTKYRNSSQKKKDEPYSQHIFGQVLFIFLPNIWKMYVQSS